MKNNKYLNILQQDIKNLIEPKFQKFFNGKIVTVTGASGLIGVNFVIFFYLLTKLSIKPKKINLVFNSYLPNYLSFLKKDKKFNFIKLNLTKSSNKIPYSDIIIHSAGYAQPQKFIKRGVETLLLNSLSLVNLTSKIKKNGSFIFLSSSEIYSGLFGNITEEKVGNTNTTHQRACYIEGKRFGETYLNLIKKTKKINTKSVRVCLAYGPGIKKDDKRVLSQFIDKAITKRQIKLIDDGSAIRSYIFISDVIKMILNILVSGKDTIYNIGGKSKITIYELAKKVGAATNSKVSKKNNYILNSAPKAAFVSIKKYENEFGKFNLKTLNYGIQQSIKWQKIIKK